jgi:hypothetical protein
MHVQCGVTKLQAFIFSNHPCMCSAASQSCKHSSSLTTHAYAVRRHKAANIHLFQPPMHVQCGVTKLQAFNLSRLFGNIATATAMSLQSAMSAVRMEQSIIAQAAGGVRMYICVVDPLGLVIHVLGLSVTTVSHLGTLEWQASGSQALSTRALQCATHPSDCTDSHLWHAANVPQEFPCESTASHRCVCRLLLASCSFCTLNSSIHQAMVHSVGLKSVFDSLLLVHCLPQATTTIYDLSLHPARECRSVRTYSCMLCYMPCSSAIKKKERITHE